MISPQKDTPSERPSPNKRNSSSRTKTGRANRKKDKRAMSLDQARGKVQKLIEIDELLLPKLFDDAAIEAMLAEDTIDAKDRRARVYTVSVTLSLFMQQVLAKDRGCKEVVTLFNKKRKAQGLKPVSTNTTSYCSTRERIPLRLIERLVAETALLATENIAEEDLWNSHNVVLVDGFVVGAPDMPENQAVYPQPSSQKSGLGFPQIRACIATSLHSRVITNIKYGPVEGKKTGEATLFREMFRMFKPGDVIVADSNFESFRDLATLYASGVYMVCDKNASRDSPFDGAVSAVIEDKRVKMLRPKFDKSRFTREEWEQLPETLTVRMIRYKVKGRKEEITIVTTLLDEQAYPAKELAALYKLRWECELDIDAIKSLMGLTLLSCHTPAMLERELMTYVLAYNVICVTMCDVQKISGHKPRDFSFKNAKDSWLHFGNAGDEANDYAWLLWSIADAPLRKRPGRNEPREVKRRQSKYPKLKKPRAQQKAALAA